MELVNIPQNASFLAPRFMRIERVEAHCLDELFQAEP